MVNKNIGKIESVIRAAIRASKSINYGTISNPDINLLDNVTLMPAKDSNPGAFIWGIHKWGDKKYRVSK